MDKIICPILGTEIPPETIRNEGATIEYETDFVGRVRITQPAWDELARGNFERFLIAGICKSRTLKGEEPVLINSSFIREDYKKFNPPLEFDEKCFSFLQNFYVMGGKDNKSFDLNSSAHIALAFASPEEFQRIIDQLESERFISISKPHNMSGGRKLYMGVKLTKSGREEATKGLPKMPLFGLISQEISTGDTDTDKKINQARLLFFSDPPTMENMRSACETLSFLLEPVRENLKNYFSTKDVSDFFNIVNNFDIRHNNKGTKDLQEPEQLEWIFYSLLNTINTYTKLKSKGR